MSVTQDIVATWRNPRRVIARQLAGGQREDRALAYAMGACALIFISQLPVIARQAHLDDTVPLEASLQYAAMAWLLVAPLLLYGVAAVSHIVLMIFGGKGSWFGARLALFWSLLASTPLWLFYGMVRGFIGEGPAEQAVGAILLIGFGVIWLLSLLEAEGMTRVKTAEGSPKS
ncbi:YIP1 family protein [Actibacterium pelagium]|uniref:Yip1 domain-containing protein n=1 Tax=Actibacterium pelagium TaxID=2029103 RepID=A0A917ADU0_9RHOB|nr:YIP1 family protein [Actibacterium pelagium]GGE41322.1 hypothetical protein GCM10011517_06160 [Actibacterium pelagium]